MIQVFVFNVFSFLICFDFKTKKTNKQKSTSCVGLLDNRLINKPMHTETVQALQRTAKVSPEPQRAYPTWRKSQLSINQVSVYTRTLFLPSDHLFAGENTYCFLLLLLLLCQTKTLQRKRKLSEVPIQEEVSPPTVITVYIYIYR